MGNGITMANWLRLLISAVIAMNAQVHGEVNVTTSFLQTAISKGAGIIFESNFEFYYLIFRYSRT